MKHKFSTAVNALSFVLKIFIKNAPFKLLSESLLAALKNILVVLNAVWLLEYLTDLIYQGRSFERTFDILILVCTINAAASIVQNWYTYCVKPKSDLKIKRNLETSLMTHAEKLPLYYYENSDFYTTVQQAKDCITGTIFTVYNEFIQIFANIAAAISAVIVVVKINPLLLIFIIFTVPMIMISLHYGQMFSEKRMKLAFWERKKQYARQAWLSKETVREFKTTNAFRIVDKYYEDACDAEIAINTSIGKNLFIWDCLGRGFSISFIWIICYLYGICSYTFSDDFSLSSFSVMFVAIMNMISKIRKIYKSYERVCGCRVQLDALKKFWECVPENTVAEGLSPALFKSLEFRNVWFAYDKEHWVLKNVSFKIEAGKKTAVLGYNGAGKSTLLKLILRFYDVQKGEILYNGININKYRLDEYRKIFSAAFQDSQMFSLTLEENILINGGTSIAGKEMDNALKNINMGELTGSAKKILGREYDKDGLVLSGGQRQKIAITRMAFDAFDIALLDEPSSALDPVSGKQMLDTVLKIVENKTMLMVSHDMSVTKKVDYILFFESGELVEQGTHSQLMENDKKYASFFRYQSEVYQKMD